MTSHGYPTIYYISNAQITAQIADDSTFNASDAIPLSEVEDAYKVEFDNADTDQYGQPLAQISLTTAYGDENTVDEPEISGDTKSLNKQNVGALPEVLEITGNVSKTADGSAILAKLKKFYRSKQVHALYYPYGRLGFYSAIEDFGYYDLRPTNILGLSMKPPKVTNISQKTQVDFTLVMMLGGRDLVNQPGVGPP